MALPSGTVTFLFTDIEGSTQMWETAPDVMRLALERHDGLTRAAIEAHDGYVFATGGDGFCVAFAGADGALASALEIQAALGAEEWPDEAVIRVRMGVHTGEAAERDGDYFGPAVNRAGRLMATAHGGQVVCSQSTATLVDDPGRLVSLGEHRLRDLAAAEQVFQVGDGHFPMLRSVDAVPTNLPTMRTELIGRSDDVVALGELVGRERLVTLTGTGGVGKTRLALAVAAAKTADFADGCWLVELSPVDDRDELVKAVAAAMGAQAMTAEAVGNYLSDRRALIVLDNCEHVLDDAAELVDAAMAVAPGVHVLTTSREPLGLEGERVRRVQSLGVPTRGFSFDEASQTSAVRLFEERATAGGDFTLGPDNIEAVVEICRKLDGIPLAIELAAARARAMAPDEIASRLDERFRLLAGGSRRSQERHRTLQAAVSWSHDLLTEDETVVFRLLAVFPASFDLAAAEVVADAGDIDVVDCLLHLVDRSLVLFDPALDRYRLLETLRQYGADRLAEAGETEATHARHARHFLTLDALLGPALRDDRYAAAFEQIIAELENLRAAAEWCIDEEKWTDLAALAHDGVWGLVQSAPMDCCDWYQHAIDNATALSPQVVVDVLGEFAWIKVSTIGLFDEAIAMAERSHEIAVEAGIVESAWAWLARCHASLYTGDPAGAVHAAEQALAAAEASDDSLLMALAMTLKVSPLALLGDHEQSARVAEEALRRAESIGHQNSISSAVIATANSKVVDDVLDVDACIDILERHPVDSVGDLNALWLDITWGTALVDRDLPRSVAHLVRAVRSADRLGTTSPLDQALQLLALSAASGGLVDQAAALVAYTDANHLQFRIQTAIQIQVRARLDDIVSTVETGQLMARSDIMVLVTDIERSLGQPTNQ